MSLEILTHKENLQQAFYSMPEPMPNWYSLDDFNTKRLVSKYGPELAFLIGCRGVLSLRKIEPSYNTSLEKRNRLHTEKGIVFANHPTKFDLDMVMNALIDEGGKVREDFIILLKEDEYEITKKYYGDKHFRPASAMKAKRIFGEAAEFIKNGGLFIIFPSFPSERKRLPDPTIKFEAGLSYLLDKIPGDSMVYTFAINRKQALSAQAYGGPVEIFEEYDKAEDWQNIMKGDLDIQIDNPEQRKLASERILKTFLASHTDYLGDYKI